MNPLPHLRAAVIHLHGAVLIKKHQRARLIQMRGRKRNPEFDRRDGDPPFAMRIFRIPFPQLFTARLKIALRNQLVPNALETIVFDFLTVMCRVRFAVAAIKIFRAHNFRRKPELARDAIDDLLDHQHSLRSAESAKRRVRSEIRFRHEAAALHVRDVIAVIEMKHGAIRHGPRQIERPAAVRIDVDLGRLQKTFPIVTDAELRQKRMAFPGDHHVLVAIETDADFASGFCGGEGRQRGEHGRLRLFPAEAAAHSRALHDHAVHPQIKQVGDDVLHFRRMLRR